MFNASLVYRFDKLYNRELKNYGDSLVNSKILRHRTVHPRSTTTDTIDGLNRIMMNGLTTLRYDDARGNLTGNGSATYSYSADNLLLTALGGATLTYDPLNKYSGSSTSTAVRFQYDGIAAIAEYVSGSIARHYVHGPGTGEATVWYEGSDKQTAVSWWPMSAA